MVYILFLGARTFALTRQRSRGIYTNSHLILKPDANLLRLSAYIFLLENTINTEKKQKFTYM